MFLIASACSDPAGGPLQNQSLGRTTGFFPSVESDGVLCSLSAIGDVQMGLSMPFGPDKKVVTVTFAPMEFKAQRFQFLASLQYQTGESTGGGVEVNRGAAIVDPRLGDESKRSALEQRTSLFFPLTVHRLFIDAARLCDTDISGGRLGDCLDVPESTMEGAHFWCSVAPNAPAVYSE